MSWKLVARFLFFVASMLLLLLGAYGWSFSFVWRTLSFSVMLWQLKTYSILCHFTQYEFGVCFSSLCNTYSWFVISFLWSWKYKACCYYTYVQTLQYHHLFCLCLIWYLVRLMVPAQFWIIGSSLINYLSFCSWIVDEFWKDL